MWTEIFPLFVPITLFIVVGAVILLYPITKRLGVLLEVMTQQKRDPARANELADLRQYLSNLDSRMSLIEERQSFTEALLSSDRRESHTRVDALSGANTRAR